LSPIGHARSVVLVVALLAGCAGHESRVRGALEALDRAGPEHAAAALNEELEVDRSEDLPKDVGGDNALLLLDRATILQSASRYDLSQRDFGVADKQIELLDLSRNAADDLGKYLFSDDVGRYRAPPFEKLLLNTFNMMNYLARGDLAGARVEARRLSVMQRFLKDQGDSALIGLGSYLAGFTFEVSGRPDEALRYYEEALAYRQYASLYTPLRALTGGAPRTPRIAAVVAGAEPAPTLEASGMGEICVVVGYGRVPQKEPVRIPIGLALTLVAGHISPHDHATATKLAAKGLVTWVNFPRLGKTRGRYSVPQMWVDGRPAPLEHALDVEAEVRKEWDKHEGTIILAAITRMITRLVAGEAVGAAANAASGDKHGVVGLLAGLATTASLAAADTPDTRAWSTLPSNIAVGRMRLAPGRYRVELAARGRHKRYDIDVRPGSWAFVVMTALR
jgi:tetratricopeptide (TPR) repeat protein